MPALRIAAAALITVKLIEDVKEALPVIPPPPVKALTAWLVATAACWRRGSSVPEILMDGGAAAGLSMILHDLQAMLSTATDRNISAVTRGLPTR